MSFDESSIITPQASRQYFVHAMFKNSHMIPYPRWIDLVVTEMPGWDPSLFHSDAIK